MFVSVIALAIANMAAPVAAQNPENPDVDADALSDLPPINEEEVEVTIQSSPAEDPELAAPLQPLSAFDTAPAETADAAPEVLPEVRYRVQLQGLDTVKLDARFQELAALYREKRTAANAAQVAARAEEDARLAETLLRSEGYFDAVATTALDLPEEPGGEIGVAITATSGPRYALGEVEVTAPPEPRALALQALDLRPGVPIVAERIEAAEARVSLRLAEQGYPFVRLGTRDILLDEATQKGDYTLPVDAGARSRMGSITTKGDDVFGVDHIAVLARFRRGDLYDSRDVDDLRQALIATGLFSNVSVEPVETSAQDTSGDAAVDLLVTQNAGPTRNLGGSIGYGTGEGIKVTGSWTHRNMFPPEGAFSVMAVAGTQEQSLGTTFRRSNAGQRDRTFAMGASIARQDFDAYNAQTISLNASLSRASTPIWQKTWTWSLGAEVIATRETRFVAERDARTRSTYFIAALPAQIGYDGSDSLLDPTRGFRASLRASPEAQKRTGGSFENYGRLLAETSAYYPVTDSLVVAGRVRLGSILGAPRDSIAPSRRLYAGGGGSVRGFGYQQLGPKDANNDPLGGRSLTEFAVEARYRFGNFGIVPFVDAGRLGQGTMPSISGMRYGAGIGGRYYTNFGPMRLDVATPIGRKPGESRVAVYISIGQAF